MGFLQQFGHGLMHLFYPRLCDGCSNPLLEAEIVLCLQCADTLPLTHHWDVKDNETALRIAGRFPFCSAASFTYFTEDGIMQHLLHQLKYNGKKEVGIYLGKSFAAELQHTYWISDIDIICPVPLHPKKQLSRGYNQSDLIAQGMAEILQKKHIPDLLKRKRHTESQTRKTREERIENMEEAFEVNHPTEDTHILLIDDVMTTGATLEECARTLLKQKGVSVSIAAIALAV